MARPKKHDDEKRSERFNLRFTVAEREHVATQAQLAGLEPTDIDIVSSHATATEQGDLEEAKALHAVFGDRKSLAINNTKSFIGHAMGAAGALELLGNLPAFEDRLAHATINLDNLDPRCGLTQIVANEPRELGSVDYILNNSFGMLGINSALIVKRFAE